MHPALPRDAKGCDLLLSQVHKQGETAHDLISAHMGYQGLRQWPNPLRHITGMVLLCAIQKRFSKQKIIGILSGIQGDNFQIVNNLTIEERHQIFKYSLNNRRMRLKKPQKTRTRG